MEKRPVAYQIYSAREDAEKDLRGVLKQIAAMGYDGVEFAGFYGHGAPEIRRMLEEAGLQAVSSHVPFGMIEKDMAGVIAYHQQVGCPYIAIPYLDEETRPGAPGFARTLAAIAKFGALCKEAGIVLLYHNHDFEFCQVSGQYGLDFMYDAIPAHILQTEMDVCWIKYAGLDPVEYLPKYAGRCPVVHLKDYVGSIEGRSPYALIGIADSEPKGETTAFEFRPFGYGSQDAKAVVETSIQCGAKWFVVEQDMSVGRTPLEAAEMSIGTLKKIGVK